MSKRILVSLVLLTVAALQAFAQTSSGGTYSSYTPYSVYGIGDLSARGTAYNKTMGGVGIAGRDNHYINSLNPAAITARDSLAVMGDMSLILDNKYFKQGDMKSVSNVFNLGNLTVTLPIYRSSALMIGISPYSSVGYYASYPDQSKIIGFTGTLTDVYAGKGSLYQLYAAAGVTFFKRLSLGAEFKYLFGNIVKDYSKTFSESEFLSNYYDYSLILNGCTGKFGLQYEQPIGNSFRVCLGVTYTMATRLGGTISKTVYSAESDASVNTTIDTLANRNPGVYISSEKGVGLCVNYRNQIRVEFDYTRSDWSDCNFQNVPGLCVNSSSGSLFTPSLAQSFRLGVEYTPNRGDIRYYHKRISYRVGGYYNQEYYKIGGNNIAARGITLGATLPVFRWYNGVTIGMELGQRGTLNDSLVRENYINFSFGVNLFDIWFQKPKYQ